MNNLFNKLKPIMGPYLTKKRIDITIITAAVILGINYNWELKDIALFVFVVWVILNPWKSQDFAKIALFFLLLTPISLIMGKDNYSEQFAIYAYYFLILTVIRAAVELKSSKSSIG